MDVACRGRAGHRQDGRGRARASCRPLDGNAGCPACGGDGAGMGLEPDACSDRSASRRTRRASASATAPAIVRQDGMIAVADAIAAAALSSATKSANPVAVAFVRESHLRQDRGGLRPVLRGAGRGEGRRSSRLVALPDAARDRRGRPRRAARAQRKGLRTRSRGAKVKVLERCGHWTPIEQPKDCARLASDHIRACAT